MRVGTLGVLLLLLPGCGPSAPPAAAEKPRPRRSSPKTKTEVDVWATLGDYYGPPAPIVLDPPPVPPEIMGPTPMDRLPKP